MINVAINKLGKVLVNYEYVRHKRNEATLPLSGGPLVLSYHYKAFLSLSLVSWIRTGDGLDR